MKGRGVNYGVGLHYVGLPYPPYFYFPYNPVPCFESKYHPIP